MAQSINERFMDFQVAQQVRWIRYQNKEVAEALKILNRVDKQLAAALRDADPSSGRYTQARLKALQKQVTELITTLHQKELEPVLMENLSQASVLSAEAEEKAFRRLMPAGVDVTTPNLGVLQVAASLKPFNGAVMKDWVDQLRTNDLKRTWQHILDGITTGVTTDELIRTLNGSKELRYKDGVREVSRRGVEALVRTSINHATNQGRQMVWDANQDIIKGVRWVSTLDMRTTPICRHNDGRVGPVVPTKGWTPPEGSEMLDPPMARPPAHPNCRSTTVAITKSWKELGFDVDELPPATRASMDGQVPGNVTYYDWLARQSADVQKEVLGKTRYDLWKNQGVAPEKFVNDQGELLTLSQLRAKLPRSVAELVPDAAPQPGYVRIVDSPNFDLTDFRTAQTTASAFLNRIDNLVTLDPKDFGLDEWPTSESMLLLPAPVRAKILGDARLIVVNTVEGGKPKRYQTNLKKTLEKHGLIAKPLPEPVAAPVTAELPKLSVSLEDVRGIEEARANGYSITTDGLDIEDHNVVFHVERGLDGKEYTVATFKVREEAYERVKNDPRFQRDIWNPRQKQVTHGHLKEINDYVFGDPLPVVRATFDDAQVVVVTDEYRNAMRAFTQVRTEGKGKAAVERALRALQEMGIDANAPSKLDREYLYAWRIMTSRSETMRRLGRAELDPSWATMSLEDKLAWMKTTIAEELGDDVVKGSNWDPFGARQGAFGDGRVNTYRADYLADPEWDDFASQHHVFHSWNYAGTQDTLQFFEMILNSGGSLVSLTERVRRGISLKFSASANSDFQTGGGDYFFTRVRHNDTGLDRVGLYMRPKLVARSDAIHYSADLYGRTDDRAFIFDQRAKGLKEHARYARSTSNELILKGSQSLFDEVEFIVVKPGLMRSLIELFQKHGITTWPDGRPLGQVIREVGDLVDAWQ
ncbi:head morphogenesis protein [Pseudanabaena phage Pan1]|nr:head morphogenesis protein [Pseudanabaena phage Pan1]